MLSSERLHSTAPDPRSPAQCRPRHGGTSRGRRRPCPTRRCRLPLCIDGRLEAEEATNQVGRGRGDPRAAEQGRSEQAAPAAAAAASTDRSIPPRTDPNASAPLYLLVYTCAHHTDAPAPAPAPASSTLDELAPSGPPSSPRKGDRAQRTGGSRRNPNHSSQPTRDLRFLRPSSSSSLLIRSVAHVRPPLLPPLLYASPIPISVPSPPP